MCRLSVGSLLLAVALLSAASTWGDAPAGSGKTKITLTTREWSPSGGYQPLPGVMIRVLRAGGSVTREKSDKDGKVTLEVPSGEPVTLILHMSRDYVPEIQNLAAE